MKIKSALITEASGSIGGMTASHNRGGLYLRARAIPTNPNSPQQQVVRGIMAQLTSLWLDVLTPGQRQAWDNYALNVPLPDPLGEPRHTGGLQMYVRSNSPRLQIGLPRVDDGPTIFNLGAYTNPFFDAPSEALGFVVINFTALDEWVNEDDAAMITYTARPQNVTINYFKGPYRRAGFILGDLAIPPVSPVNTTPAFTFVEGQAVFVRVNVTRADGRLGAEQFFKLIAGP